MNTETKRHIDAARQVLVGVVPNPTSQIEQITNALIYKFMDDMDQAAIKAGGEPAFFVGELEPYAWTRIMDSRLGNQERMNLYAEALVKFSQAKQLPELFRGIFKSAFLPYRSPETLGLFLKEIDYFDYSHPEELGNAYEYLLSIMSSQGDAGQFRTPRHIIDFMVDVINPTKDDKVLDPACGTGGFLISAYKLILEQHDGKNDPDKIEKPLTPDDRKKLVNNFEGYDVDPTMVRIAQVNMYLHQFKNPKIYQYNTLSMEERWGDKFDVILANPPFMSPKGGVPKSKKFSSDSNRSEVLFVDYIVNHLRPKGRAGIIVPEGIIFQSGAAHKALRKSLINDGLYAVVSLPSGVFAPYSGVKTSILLLNNELAKLSKDILFIKIENDGFDLGATKRPIGKNDLPQALQELRAYQDFIETGKTATAFTERIKKENTPDTQAVHHDKFILVKKSLIEKNGDYSLSGDRYKPSNLSTNNEWPMVELGEVLEYEQPTKYLVRSIDYKDDYPVPVLTAGKTFTLGYTNEEDGIFRDGLPVIIFDDFTTATKYVNFPFKVKSSAMKILHAKKERINIRYAFLVMQKIDFPFKEHKRFWISEYSKIKIPLPPLEIQEQIVKELDGYAAIINGAKQIVTNWKPKIDIDSEWKNVKLSEVCDVRDGTHDSPKQVQEGYPLITSKNIKDGRLDFSNVTYISEEDFRKVSQRSYVDVDDIIMPMIGTIGGACLIKSKKIEFAIKNVALFKKSEQIIPEYLLSILDSDLVKAMFENQSAGATQKFVSLGVLRGLEIPLPPIEIQKQIVEKIETERELVESAKKLIKIYEDKTKSALEKLYGHDN